eukprot:3944122-Amphidinium_carterae.2
MLHSVFVNRLQFSTWRKQSEEDSQETLAWESNREKRKRGLLAFPSCWVSWVRSSIVVSVPVSRVLRHAKYAGLGKEQILRFHELFLSYCHAGTEETQP